MIICLNLQTNVRSSLGVDGEEERPDQLQLSLSLPRLSSSPAEGGRTTAGLHSQWEAGRGQSGQWEASPRSGEWGW